MNGIYLLTHYLLANSFMDSIIQTLRRMLSVLLNIVMASFNFLLIGFREHTIPMFRGAMGFYTVRPGVARINIWACLD